MTISADKFSIGLTGGIGSGKSLVADMFGKLGVGIIDTDQIAHSLTAADGAAMPAIGAVFGPAFITPQGALDRKAMREKIFADPSARQQLEAILHPMINAQTLAAVNAADAAHPAPYLMVVVPLLVESGRWKAQVDRILVVDCSEPLQQERVMHRNNLNQAQVAAIMATQASRAQRLAAADDVIVNEDGIAAVEEQVARMHADYLALAERKSKK
jgi:dephospho-CoA kinase